MSIHINNIRKHYLTLPNEKLWTIVKNGIRDLTADGIQVLKEEVSRRGDLPLLSLLNQVLKNQANLDFMIEERCRFVRDLPCPICESEEYKLNGVMISTVSLSSNSLDFHLGCYNCLIKKKNDAASIFNFLTPGGLFDEHESLKYNERQIQELLIDRPTAALWAYVANLVRADLEEEQRRISRENQLNLEKIRQG
jgi:hypothetical protein